MAGDWLKMRVGLRRHPKVVRIVSALKADRLRVVGGLYAVWSVFDEHSADGILPGYSFEMMDEEIGWPGFAAAMHGVGWLDRDGDCGLKIPEFSKHNGQSAKRRAQETHRKRESRVTERNPSASAADKNGTREEKEKRVTTGEANASPVTELQGGSGKPTPVDSKEVVPTGITNDTWDAYCQAYVMRYGVSPVRNASVNGQLANFVKRLGIERAPRVATFYLTHNHRRYLDAKHPVNLMVQFAETLHTEWATQKPTTETEARQADRTAARGNVFTELIEEAERGAERNAA